MLKTWEADKATGDADKKKEADSLKAEITALKEQMATLTSDQPRIFGFGGFRPSTDASTISADKTKAAQDKQAAPPQTPMDSALALADSFLGDA